MEKSIAQFKPSVAEATKIVEQYKGLKIKGIDDKEGYDAVFKALQELKTLRVDITKFGKKEREEALAWQREVLKQEKELLSIIVPVEDALKSEREKVDDEKKRQERMVLLPSRKKILKEILEEISDDEILAMDEKEFSAFYTEKKMAYLEELEREKKADEEARAREKELEKAKTEAAEKARAEERERAERERKAEEEKRIQTEADRLTEETKIEREKLLEQAKTEKNRKYKAWLKKNGADKTNDDTFIVQRAENTFKLYKKIDEITIK